MTDMHYDDPQFEIVDGPSHLFDTVETPDSTDTDDDNDNEDIEILREN